MIRLLVRPLIRLRFHIRMRLFVRARRCMGGLVRGGCDLCFASFGNKGLSRCGKRHSGRAHKAQKGHYKNRYEFFHAGTPLNQVKLCDLRIMKKWIMGCFLYENLQGANLRCLFYFNGVQLDFFQSSRIDFSYYF